MEMERRDGITDSEQFWNDQFANLVHNSTFRQWTLGIRYFYFSKVKEKLC